MNRTSARPPVVPCSPCFGRRCVARSPVVPRGLEAPCDHMRVAPRSIVPGAEVPVAARRERVDAYSVGLRTPAAPRDPRLEGRKGERIRIGQACNGTREIRDQIARIRSAPTASWRRRQGDRGKDSERRRLVLAHANIAPEPAKPRPAIVRHARHVRHVRRRRALHRGDLRSRRRRHV